MSSSESAADGAGRPPAPAYAVGGLVRALSAVRLVVLVLAAGESLVSRQAEVIVLVALAAAPFSFVPALNWRTRGPAYFRNGVLLAADIVITVAVLVELAGPPLIATYAAATVALWGVTAGLRIALVMAIPVVMLLTPWSQLLQGWRGQALALVTVTVVVAMAYAGSALGRSVRRQQQTAVLLALEREALAAAQERLRLARDLHDTVAGDLAGLTMLTQALQARLVAEGASEQTAARARAIVDAVREAHRHTRSTLDGLRVTSGNLDDDIPSLVELWSERTGVVAHVHRGAGLGAVDPAVADDAVLVVRELLENVRKHARAARAEVRVEAGGGLLEVTVDDDGCGLTPMDGSGGHHGIQGVRERAEGSGGNAQWGPSPLGGTRARVVFRLAPAEDAARAPASVSSQEVA